MDPRVTPEGDEGEVDVPLAMTSKRMGDKVGAVLSKMAPPRQVRRIKSASQSNSWSGQPGALLRRAIAGSAMSIGLTH